MAKPARANSVRDCDKPVRADSIRDRIGLRSPFVFYARFAAVTLAIGIAWLCSLDSSFAAKVQPQIVYDSDFGGYVAVVDGIQRPDLSFDARTGRAPTSYSRALKLTRRGLKRERKAERRGKKSVEPRGEPSKRWMRRVAAITELEIVDTRGTPIEGARVYRYVDPSLYPVNDSPTGSRLYDAHRYLPYPFPAINALQAVQLHDEYWQDQFMATVRETTRDIDQTDNPWLRNSDPAPTLPLEYIGETDVSGALRSVCGVFNVHDDDRFRWATAPPTFRVGFIIIADGFHAAFSERKFDRGGVTEERTIRLLNGVGFEVFQSASFRVAQRLSDEIDLEARPLEDVIEEVNTIIRSVETELYKVPERERAPVRVELEAVLLARMGRRAPPQMATALARRVANIDPDNAARRYRFARAQAASRGVFPIAESRVEIQEPDPVLREAELLCKQIIQRNPGFSPAYPLLYALMQRRGAPTDEMLALVERLIAVRPFDRWARSRMAVLYLKSARPTEAFDHLRYGWMMDRGMAGDRELGVTLADHYWKLGLTSKAGFFSRMLSGRTPEDPAERALSTRN